MAAIVFCHGAWGGGWGWSRVAELLRAKGHKVFTPTYTGLGERAHLLTPDVDLATHIRDIRAVIRWEGLEDFVLVGHSYGGMVITGVADLEWRRIRRLVYLDAFLPADGQSVEDLAGAERAKATFELADRAGDGWKVPRPEGSISPKLPEEDRDWLDRLGSPHPLASFTQRLRIDGNHLNVADKVYVLATDNPGSPFPQFADWTRGRAGWTTREFATHHHLHLSMPEETAAIVVENVS
jgi:pimeloyl-ACP methyl ester carboxylesterase